MLSWAVWFKFLFNKVIATTCLFTLTSFSKQSASWKVLEIFELCALSTDLQGVFNEYTGSSSCSFNWGGGEKRKRSVVSLGKLTFWKFYCNGFLLKNSNMSSNGTRITEMLHAQTGQQPEGRFLSESEWREDSRIFRVCAPNLSTHMKSKKKRTWRNFQRIKILKCLRKWCFEGLLLIFC